MKVVFFLAVISFTSYSLFFIVCDFSLHVIDVLHAG